MTDALEVLVLVANDREAIICSNCNGVTHLIHRCRKATNPHECSADYVGQDCGARRKFARHLMVMLERDAHDHAYDGVIILADASIYSDLRRTRTSNISHLLIVQPVAPEIVFGVMQ